MRSIGKAMGKNPKTRAFRLCGEGYELAFGQIFYYIQPRRLDTMKQFTPSEAKKLVKNILAEKKKKAEYFQANGTLKGFASAK